MLIVKNAIFRTKPFMNQFKMENGTTVLAGIQYIEYCGIIELKIVAWEDKSKIYECQ